MIDRRVRELSVVSVLLPFDTPAKDLTKYKALILSGGPESVYSSDSPSYDPAIFDLGIPIFGICYGMQLLSHHHNGKIEKGEVREDGEFQISFASPSPLFDSIPDGTEVLLTHRDSVVECGKGFEVTARTAHGVIAAIQNTEKKYFGVQFHPEVDLTQHGTQMFQNFLYNIAGCSASYNMDCKVTIAVDYIRKTVGDASVLVLVSGGVDSSVCAALMHEALPADKVNIPLSLSLSLSPFLFILSLSLSRCLSSYIYIYILFTPSL